MSGLRVEAAKTILVDAQATSAEAKIAPIVLHELAQLTWGPQTLPKFVPNNTDIGLNTAALVYGPLVCSALGKERAKALGEKTYLVESTLIAGPVQEFLKRTPKQRAKDAGNAVVGYSAGSALAVLAELNPWVLGTTAVIATGAAITGAYQKRAEITDACKQVSAKTTSDLDLIQHARHLRQTVGAEVYGGLPMLIPGGAGYKMTKAMVPTLKAELPSLAKTAFENTVSQLGKCASWLPKIEPPLKLLPEAAGASTIVLHNEVKPIAKDYIANASGDLNKVPPKVESAKVEPPKTEPLKVEQGKPEIEKAAPIEAKKIEGKSEPFDIVKAAEAITEKFNDRHISIARLENIVDSAIARLSAKDRCEVITQREGATLLKTGEEHAREVALAVLKTCSDNCSTKGVAENLRALKTQLKEFGFCYSNVFTGHASSSGNLLGYLFRKNNDARMSINDLDLLKIQETKPKKIFLFDDLSTLKLPADKIKLLQSIPNVIVGDIASFEKGINYLDFAKGDAFVAKKLAGLISEAKEFARQNPELNANQIATEMFTQASQQAAKKLGENVQVVAAKAPESFSKTETTLSELSDLINRPITNVKAVQNFLERTPTYCQPIAAKLFKEGVVRLHTEDMLERSTSVVKDILTNARELVVEAKDVLFVSDEDPGGSSHLMNYLALQTGLLKPSNFVSNIRLQELAKSPSAQKQMVVVMDDIIYTGTQLFQRLNCASDYLSKFKQVNIGCMGAFEAGQKKILNSGARDVYYTPTNVMIHTPETYHNFTSSKNEFFKSLSLGERCKLEDLVQMPGWGEAKAYHMLPYMYPDNNLLYIGDFMSKVMGLPSSVILLPIGVGAALGAAKNDKQKG